MKVLGAEVLESAALCSYLFLSWFAQGLSSKENEPISVSLVIVGQIGLPTGVFSQNSTF